MRRLLTTGPPNNALQRTRVRPAGGRSPLSFETFGAHSMKRRIGLLALVAIAPVGCTETLALRYGSAAVTEGRRSYRLAAGSAQVFELSRTRFLPIPDAFSGYVFYLEVDPGLVREGEILQVPSDGVKPYLLVINAPSYRRSTACQGSVRLAKVRDTFLEAAVDLRANDVGWAYRGTAKLMSAIVTPTLHPLEAAGGPTQ
jgi:hypothetical protein